MKIESEISIKLVFATPEITEAIDKSTKPENIETPENVSASSEMKNNELLLTIKSKGNIMDLITTVEDYLEKIDLSYKTIKSIK
ncbi:MAG TPA: KEOPS complex subunit Pcc1 [Candidatus Bathyarchaeia archaeon]|nr:KEOPS complex subunit Pcc1 [Candidatus Bathyarchaeia archaeon]